MSSNTRRTRSIVALIAAAAIATASCEGSGSGPAASAADVTQQPAPSADPHLWHYVDLETGATSPMPANVEDTWSLVSSDGMRFLYRGDDGSLYVSNIDGSDGRRVTPTGVEARLGGWSPDGSTIVFQAGGGERRLGNVFTVDIATGETTQLTDLEQVRMWTWVTDMEPAFSPDGRTVFFHRPRASDRVWDIWSVPVTGGEPSIVRRDAGWGRYSPDGESLAYLAEFSDGDLSGRMVVADSAGGPARELVDAFRTSPPIWSPDGTRIAYLAQGVRVLDLATGETAFVAGCGGPIEWLDDDTLIVGPGGC